MNTAEQTLNTVMYLVAGGFLGAMLTVVGMIFIAEYVDKKERMEKLKRNRQQTESRKYWYGDESEDEVKRMLDEVNFSFKVVKN